MRNKILILFSFIGIINLMGCYSFTGASVPTHLNTIAIPLFDDQSGSGEPALREKITNELIEKFRQDNSLEVADKTTADSMIEGTIITMTDQPQVVAKGETVSKRRITISVKIVYQDMKLKKKVYEKNFNGWSDFESGGSAAERELAIETAIDKLSEDILLETVSGW
ncbi:MAG: LptE family protein [Ignavibacteriales bacterium]|nr:LptE family protein [Ignavibacteriales bacterium]